MVLGDRISCDRDYDGRRYQMVGTKLLWTGLTIIIALGHYVPQSFVVGGVLMTIGLVLFWLDK